MTYYQAIFLVEALTSKQDNKTVIDKPKQNTKMSSEQFTEWKQTLNNGN